MSVFAANQALLSFLGIPPNALVVRVEVTATQDDYPKVIVTQLLTDTADITESRLFYLVPRSEKP